MSLALLLLLFKLLFDCEATGITKYPNVFCSDIVGAGSKLLLGIVVVNFVIVLNVSVLTVFCGVKNEPSIVMAVSDE